MTEKKKQHEFVKLLLTWFDKNRRDFPWRETTDVYKIFVAEILLQRTRAENVVPVYKNFLKKYPSIEDLSSAKIGEIEETIRSLGLFESRAKRLKNIAKIVTEKYDGKMPLNAKRLMNFKGIGHYTARAILCFTETKEKAVVDWNVARVIERFFDYDMKSSPHTDKNLMKFMQNLIPKGKGKEFNWAILDFSALVCRPISKNCDICPINHSCNKHMKEK